jgi:hypothetical protein
MTATLSRTVPLVDSTPLLTDHAALRARAESEGYLFFRQLLPKDQILDVRLRLLGILQRHGWIQPGTDLADGIADREAFARVPKSDAAFCGVGVGRDAYLEVQKTREFHDLSLHPALIGAFEALYGTEVLAHPRNIARLMITTDDFTPTAPHQDFIHIQGSTKAWTAWFPLGDCPVDLGGITPMVGSQADGVLSYHASEGPGGLEAYLCDMPYPWAVGDYEAGDVITFSCRTVHRALPNLRPEFARLSADFRYQPANEPVDAASLQVHCDIAPWEEIYADWDDRSNCYHWQDKIVGLTEWDESIRWQQDKIC